MWRGRRTALALAALLTVFAAGLTNRPVHATAPTLPADRLHFGISNDPSELSWMTSSGVPWRYRYTYLAGGVGTGQGWETWQDPALPPGQYAVDYMSASRANGYIPVFPYYELLQSAPRTSDEGTDDFNNLNNATLMAAYYANFRLLMQRAGAYGGTVVVHVEPDLWGYLQQRAGSGDAASVTASVASSGDADAAGLPNTVQGFALALLHLRDRYAPNALLAIHASLWSSGIDVGNTTDPNLDVVAEADKTAAFLNSAGMAPNGFGTSSWDLVFNDVDDHDAAWWEAQGADNASFTHWWDPTNRTVPNFSRYVSWVSELHSRTARPQIVWQVPEGNQYFLTENNTAGHYQDNVAQYFLAHPADLYAAGLIAVLFGAGNPNQTTSTDATGDGVTNNNGVPTTDGAGWCNACNTHVSQYADDDGGFLRTFVGQYYAGGPPPPPPAPGPVRWGGAIVGSPDAAAGFSAGRVDVVVESTDHAVWHAWSTDGRPAQWESLGGVAGSSPSAVAWGPNRLDVFVRGSDGQLWHRWYSGGWHPWEPLGGQLAGAPDAASWSTNRLDVVVRGTDNHLWHKWWDGSSWRGWENLGGSTYADPSDVSTQLNQLEVFASGTDNALWHRWWDGAHWSNWYSLGGFAVGGPDASSWGSGRVDVFVRGADNATWRRFWDPTGGYWRPWSSLGGAWTSDPGAADPAPGTIDVFERGGDAAVWQVTLPG